MLRIICSLFVLPVVSYHLGVSDIIIGLLATISLLTGTVAIAFCRTGTQYIVGTWCGDVAVS